MKIFSLILFTCFFGLSAQSQTSKEERPYYYIGKYDNKNLYIQSTYRQQSNRATLYELTDDEIVESEKIEIRNALIHQLYIFEEAFYAITSSVTGDKFYLTTFDKFLKEKESIEILSLTNNQMRGLRSGDYSLKFYHRKDHAAVVIIGDEITVCSLNFTMLDSKTFTIPTRLNTHFISDVYLEENLDVYISRRDELFHFKNGVLQTPKISRTTLPGTIDEWKFVDTDSDPYLVSMITQGGSVRGFAYAPLNPESIQLKECVVKPEKVGSRGKIKLTYNSLVKAEINENKLICTVQRIEQAINETIMISCIDIPKQENLWNFQVLSVHDAPYIWKENQNPLNRASFSFIQDGKLFFFFNAAVKKLNPENFFETDKRVITYDISIQTTIIQSEIDLNTGENSTKPLHADFKSESFKIFNSSYHLDDKNNLHFITYKEYNNKPYYEMLKPEKKVETVQL